MQKLEWIKEIEQEINRDDLIYKIVNKEKDKTFDSPKLKIIRFFQKEIYSSIITLNVTLEGQINLKIQLDKFKECMKP